ncbi:ABC transporter ATP-binding protein [Corynebacterium marinum]|uniref:ABC-type quaternary amine transporter n=1 Tax=Corynebacterium marinum DSM 44953 TaxID=1224162 RepID=A0A0B6TGI9_9CORY|nr:ABC transporter ATP-binding protein [Corynebacterium marinum]AJK69097.1 spermidine/putrescine ABC transporter ATPase [Corynebacterium marinum DSM 44953]GGO17713.1 iron ABC transporter ATP-binding protein [Corynebacterium marinum]
MTPDLSVRGLSATYGRRSTPVLREISLDLPDGELLAVLGPSGCGKTTLLRVIAGLLPATSGTVSLAGREVTALAPEKRRVGLVPQEAALFPHLTIADNIAFGIRHVPAARRRARVAELMELVDVTALADRRSSQVSGGQAQRVALARALAPAPDLVLLDEPFAALDAALRTRLRRDVAAILREAGTAAVIVTHDQDEALSMADLVAVLRAGEVAQSGSPAELYAHPTHAWVANFLGTCAILEDGRVLRPEQITLTPAAPAVGPAARLSFDAEVVHVEFFGHSTLYQLRPARGLRLAPQDRLGAATEDTRAGLLFARELGSPRFTSGQAVVASVAADLPAVPLG